MSSNNCPVFSFWGSFSSINHSSTFFFVFNLRNIQSLSLPWPRSFTRDSLRYKTPLAPTNSCWKWNPCVQYHIEHLSSKSNFRKQWKDRPAVCSLVVDCHWFLADSLSLLHEAAEGQGAPETLLLTGRKTNSLHFTSWTSSRSNVLLTLRCVCVCVCVCVHSEYWHSWAGGRPRGRRSNWSSRNVLHLSLCQLLLPRGVQPGLDERSISFAF